MKGNQHWLNKVLHIFLSYIEKHMPLILDKLKCLKFHLWGTQIWFEDCLNGSLPLEPQNSYPCLRVILAENDTHFSRVGGVLTF